MRKIELLAPAGSEKAFIGAINAGANAIYLSGKSYGARKYAENFTDEKIVELIEYAHLRNVLVYVTINTLIFENEIKSLFIYTDFLVKQSVDALIVQDLGVINQFIKRYPNTEIHASTQMNVYNIEQLKYLKKIGVSRAILARETSIDDLKEIKKEVDIDLEVFIHGALCISYSGNCLFSSMNGGRSGNRGECTQSCRLKYSLFKDGLEIEPNSYLLSAKDLMTIDNLSLIVSSGVTSLKIEGRMRKPEYVVATVRAYREVLDNKAVDINKKIKELKSVFNREYTKGYILNENPNKINNSFRPNHQGIEVGKVINYERGKTTIKLSETLAVGDGIRILGKNDLGGQVGRILSKGLKVTKAFKSETVVIDMQKKVDAGSIIMKTLDTTLENSLRPYLSETFKLIELTGSLDIKVGKQLSLKLQTDFSQIIEVKSEYIVELANNPNQSKDKILTQFNKFGNTQYYLADFKILTDGLGFIPNQVLNKLRREGLEKLELSILNYKENKIIKDENNLIYNPKPQEFSLIVKIETKDQLEAAKKENIKDIYIAENLHFKKADVIGSNYYLAMNRIWYKADEYKNYNNILINDIGGISLIKGKKLIANSTFNIINSYSLYALLKEGIEVVTVSQESSLENTKDLVNQFVKRYQNKPNLAYIVYGKTELMLSKYCPIAKSEGLFNRNCNLCQTNEYALVNEKKQSFRIIRDGYCNIKILHHEPLNLIRYMQELRNIGVNHLRLDFSDESYDQTIKIIQAFKNKLANKNYQLSDNFYTLGRFKN